MHDLTTLDLCQVILALACSLFDILLQFDMPSESLILHLLILCIGMLLIYMKRIHQQSL